MKHLTKYALLLTVVVMAHQTRAQDANKSSFSLQEAITYAVKNSPSALNAEIDVKNAEYRKKEVAGMGLPQLKASVDIKDYIELPTSLIPAVAFNSLAPSDQYFAARFGTQFNSTAGFSASQLIFSSDYIFGLKAAREYMNLARLGVNRSKTELSAQVSKAYYTVLINRDRLQLLEANITRLKKMVDETKAMNQQGLVEQIDAERVEVQYNNLQTEKDKTLKLMGLSESMLKFQMGYNLSDPITLTDSLPNSLNDYQELAGGKSGIAQRPDYQLLMAQQSLLDLDVKRQKWGYMPTVAAYGAYQFNRQGNSLDLFTNDKTDPTKQWYKIALVGLTIDVNIFDGLQRHNKIQQTKITALKNRNDLRNLELAAELESTSAAITYNNAYSALVSQKRNLELAQHVAEVAQKKYTSGVGSNLEIVNAEAALKEAQTNYYSAIFDILVAKIDYQKATGTLVK